MIPNQIPKHNEVEDVIISVFELLFRTEPACSGVKTEGNTIMLQLKLTNLLLGLIDNPEEITVHFFEQLKTAKKQLIHDADFILKSDPAAQEKIEVIVVYPGFFAIFCYRIAHIFAKASVPLLPRMITEYAHKVTGVDIHPNATIGTPFSIDHGTGIVIGETAIIGKNVKMYQGVTLGALSVDKKETSVKRHPTIEDNVVLYAGCTILGGSTTIGHHSTIGGNVWLTESISPYSIVYHKSEVIVRNSKDLKSTINFVI